MNNNHLWLCWLTFCAQLTARHLDTIISADSTWHRCTSLDVTWPVHLRHVIDDLVTLHAVVTWMTLCVLLAASHNKRHLLYTLELQQQQTVSFSWPWCTCTAVLPTVCHMYSFSVVTHVFWLLSTFYVILYAAEHLNLSFKLTLSIKLDPSLVSRHCYD